MNGVITYWNEPKGYGFAKNDEGESHFIHISDVEGHPKSLLKGDKIRYEIEDASRGKRGVRVELIYPSNW